MTDTASDSELVAAAREGDLAAWRRLMERHLPALGAYLGARLRRPEVVDELLLDAVEMAWNYLDELDGDVDFPRWLRKMGANVALRWHKAHPNESLAEVLSDERAAQADGDSKLIRKLDAAIGSLKPDQRMAIEQRFRGGLQGQPLWEALHVDPAAGRMLLEEALESLDHRLGNALG
jgi:RNA polymerase sigma factor (sigma-70 family)